MKNTLFFLLLFFPVMVLSQTIASKDTISTNEYEDNLKFSKKQLIIPGALMVYGVYALGNDYLNELNINIRNEVREHIDEKITIDDFSQYAPATSVYVINAFGPKGKHNFRERNIILGTSFLLMNSVVLPMKATIKETRPDGTSKNSFPSGHTATAFMGAEFLWQEYKDVNVWYGITGYVVAAGTGAFRIYNGRHWFSDVMMGAGIGILSTKVAYWVYPYLDKKVFKCKKSSVMMAPFYTGEHLGVGMMLNFQ